MQLTGNAVIDRALSSLLQIGTIEFVQTKPLRYRVKFNDQRISGWMHPGVDRAGDSVSQDPLNPGEQVLCAVPFGSEAGVVICAIYRADNQPKDEYEGFYRRFADEASIEYDSVAHVLRAELPEGAKAVIKAPVEVVLDSPLVRCTTDLYAQGNITAGGDVSDSVRSMAGDRDIYDSHDHPHGDPVSGPVNQKQGGA